MHSGHESGISPSAGWGDSQVALWESSQQRLTDLATLPDKPEETLEATLAALWHLAAGRRLSARAALEHELPPLNPHGRARLARLIECRLAGAPLAYLTQRQSFMGLEMVADRGALIPRSETEILARAVIDLVDGLARDRGPVVVDVCTGGGNLAAVIATRRDDAVVWATDISAAALRVARRSLTRLGLTERVLLRQGDLLDALDEGLQGVVDLVVCNPPYLSDARRSSMPAEIHDHEPDEAFDGGPLGLRIIQRLVHQAPMFLRPGGWLAFEIGTGQGPGVAAWVRRSGRFEALTTVPDPQGEIRALIAMASGTPTGDPPAAAGDRWTRQASLYRRPRLLHAELVEAAPLSPFVASQPQGQLVIREVRPGDEAVLEVLFEHLDTTWFRPHDLGAEGAREVAHHVGKDVYLIGFLGSVPVAYGMLRGWDEGYRIPALGIAVRDGYGDRGLGRQMMHALHQVVRDHGGHRVRLRVAPDNVRARHLYDSMGYRHVGVERGENVLLLDLDTTPDATPEEPDPRTRSDGPG
jgi:release factor glutamine methyltransferase